MGNYRVRALALLARIFGITFWIEGLPFGARPKRAPGVSGTTDSSCL